jgi:hypothetical protein
VLNPPALSSSASSRASARLRARVVFVRRPRSRRSERSRLAVDRPASAAAAWRSSSASRSESVTSCPITSSVTIEQQHARKGLFLSSAGAAAAARQPRGADQRQISACVAFPPDDDTGGPSASTTAYRSRVVESACLPPRTAQAAKARSNGTVGFALSLLGSLVRSPQSRNQW